MNNIGKGIAVAGIWIGVGIASITAGKYIGLLGLIAMITTICGLMFWE